MLIAIDGGPWEKQGDDSPCPHSAFNLAGEKKHAHLKKEVAYAAVYD